MKADENFDFASKNSRWTIMRVTETTDDSACLLANGVESFGRRDPPRVLLGYWLCLKSLPVS